MLTQTKRFVDIVTVNMGAFNTKSYILRNKNHCLVIDPSGSGNSISEFLKRNFDANKVDIFATKVNKTFAETTSEITKQFKNSNVFISAKEHDNTETNLIDGSKIKFIVDNDVLLVDDEKFKVIETGSGLSLFGPESNVVFTGDSLISRKGIDKILHLPKNTIVMPSQGNESSIRIESNTK